LITGLFFSNKRPDLSREQGSDGRFCASHVQERNIKTDARFLYSHAFSFIIIFSLNNISTLADFQHCQYLVELYVRRNDIRDLSEICYLQDLPRLRRLLLSENPCVDTAGHLYRLTVIRALPNLEILDTAPVTPEEVELAMKTGLLLEHPLSIKVNWHLNSVTRDPRVGQG